MSIPLEQLEAEYARAVQHVADGRRIVAEQCQRVAKRQSQGYPVDALERTLWVFISTLECLEDHERTLRQEIADSRAELAKHRV